MTALLGISVVSAALALLFLARTLRHTRQGRLLRAGGSGLSCVVSTAIAATVVIIAFSYYSYERLTAERIVSTVEFRATGPDEFRARLMVASRPDQVFTLRGDEWQIDARLISWKPPMAMLGLEPIYRLDRLSGRYAAIDREQRELRTVHELSPEQPLDLWRIARGVPSFLLPGIDAYYGTATYVPMADGARFEVSLSRDALIARPANEAARRAVGHWGTL